MQMVLLETLGDVGHDVTATSGGTHDSRDFGNTPLSTVDVKFNALATLPAGLGGGDATHATQIACTDADGNTFTATDNDLTTGAIRTSGSQVTCTITFVDP